MKSYQDNDHNFTSAKFTPKGVKWLNADLPKAGYEKWFNCVADVKNGHEFTQCLITPEGQLKIADLWSKA